MSIVEIRKKSLKRFIFSRLISLEEINLEIHFPRGNKSL